MLTLDGSRPASAEQRLMEPGIHLAVPPEPLRTPVELEIIFEVEG
jgi:hypothetical protein